MISQSFLPNFVRYCHVLALLRISVFLRNWKNPDRERVVTLSSLIILHHISLGINYSFQLKFHVASFGLFESYHNYWSYKIFLTTVDDVNPHSIRKAHYKRALKLNLRTCNFNKCSQSIIWDYLFKIPANLFLAQTFADHQNCSSIF